MAYYCRYLQIKRQLTIGETVLPFGFLKSILLPKVAHLGNKSEY